MAQISFRDALAIRQLWAQHQLELVIDPQSADCGDVEAAAFCLGRMAYPDVEVPPLLASVPELKAWFEEGCADRHLDEQILFCNWCQDGTGNPCPIHG